tara:strand:+ start:1021 stop:1611 length:591 start_codon:yes stop_codon:yes gene_type:complete
MFEFSHTSIFSELGTRIMSKSVKYGFASVSLKSIDSKKALKEALEIGVPQGARIALGKKDTKIRSVKLWRIPINIDSHINDVLSKQGMLMADAFGYHATELIDIQYLEYHVGDNYDWHMDIDSNRDASKRKVSLSWLLNDSFTGGDLEIQIHNEIYKPLYKNTLVGFTSFLNHRVTEVQMGVRRAIVAWITGSTWK